MKIIFRKIFTIHLIMIWFIPLFAMLFIGTLSRKHDEVNWDENRALMTTDKMSSDIWDGTFQTDFETLLGDQLFGRDSFISIASGIDSTLQNIFSKTSFIGDYDIKDFGSYIIINEKTFIRKGYDSMDWKDEDLIESIEENGRFINMLSEISNVFVSPVSQYHSHYRNFMGIPGPTEYTEYFKSLLSDEVSYIDEDPWTHSSILDYKLKSDTHNNLVYYAEQYLKIKKEMNFKSDLKIGDDILTTFDQWSGNNGSYDGVSPENINFVNIENILNINYDSEYWGNDEWSRQGEEYEISEIFQKILSNETKYGMDDLYDGFRIAVDSNLTNLFFNFDDMSKGNLLVIGDSNSASMSIAYASGYNKSWFIREAANDIDIEQFIIDNKIDDVLFMPQKYGMFSRGYSAWVDEGVYPVA